MSDIKPVIHFPAPPTEDEQLGVAPKMDSTNIWSLKLPRFLLEQWETVREAGVELGTLVIDQSTNPPTLSIRLPTKENGTVTEDASKKVFDASNIPSEFHVEIPMDNETGSHSRAKNTFVFTEQQRKWVKTDPALGKRKREKANPQLLGKVAHQANVYPVQNEKYKEIVRRRNVEDGQSKKPIIRLEDTGLSKGTINQLTSGYANTQSRIGQGIIAIEKREGEKRARLERTELMDRLFHLFVDKPYWSITGLREELKQPDAWLREVLQDIAEMVPAGVYKGNWKLKPEYEGMDGIKGDKGEDEDEEDEDDDDEDDEEMEEVV